MNNLMPSDRNHGQYDRQTIWQWLRDNILVVIVLSGVCAATIPPLIYLLFEKDIYAFLELDPGIGEIKYKLYHAFLGGSLLLLGLIALLIPKYRRQRTTCLISIFVFVVAYLVLLGAKEKTKDVWAIAEIVWSGQKHETFRPVCPSLGELFTDDSWRERIADFHSFYEQAEKRRPDLEPDLKSAGLSEKESQVVAYMLFVCSIWGFGNAVHPDQVGCVLCNETNRWDVIPKAQATARVYARSDIGCCNDFAYILKRILDDAGLENRLVAFPGHIFNEVKLDGSWRVLDATTNLYVDCSWADLASNTPRRLYQFDHPGGSNGRHYRRITTPLQFYMYARAVLGRTGRPTYPKLPAHFQ